VARRESVRLPGNHIQLPNVVARSVQVLLLTPPDRLVDFLLGKHVTNYHISFVEGLDLMDVFLIDPGEFYDGIHLVGGSLHL